MALFSPGVDAKGRDFAVVAPFVPAELLADTLGRAALPRLQRAFDDLGAPERHRPAALVAMEACPRRPMQQVNRLHYYTDGSRQANLTTDSCAMAATAEDQEWARLLWGHGSTHRRRHKRRQPYGILDHI